ncbi:MAG: ABC transporter permease [Steroidobacteraceae bacterium]
MISRLALASLWNRRASAALTIAAIAVSVALLLGVQKLRSAARDGFANTVSGVDLIVGPRSGPVNLLLYSVFRIGDATSNVSWESYRKIARHPDVAWTIPLSLGDSHRGFRVLGTSDAYFGHYQFAGNRHLQFATGRSFNAVREAVLGADVALQLGYHLGSELIVAHGLAQVSFALHKNQPFVVVGILERTGTPVDRTVHVSLESMTLMHEGQPPHPDGAPVQAVVPRADSDPQSTAITAFMIGMREKAMTLTMQRAINDYRAEPLLAILPGVALAQLWSLVGIADRALLVIAACVVLAGLLGMLTSILTTLNERRREMAILRSLGASPGNVFALLMLEAAALALGGILCGVALTYALLLLAAPLLQNRFGIFIEPGGLALSDLGILAAVLASALLLSLWPAWRAYRNSLADGLTVRI